MQQQHVKAGQRGEHVSLVDKQRAAEYAAAKWIGKRF
jgi:hypothetical protein